MGDLFTDEIIFDSKAKKNRSKSLLADLEELDNTPPPIAIYDTYKKEEKKEKDKKKKKKDIVNDDYFDDDPDDWMATLSSFKAPKVKKKSKNLFDKFNLEDGSKEGKGKKKHKSGAVNHKKDFEPEMALLKNLQMEQSKFVDSLQKKYDQMESTKSTARGVGKFTTDLIISITNARSLSMQLVDKIISTKKTIADLDFKERKEFGSGSESAQQNLSNYASTYLKQVMDAGRNNVVGQPSAYDNFDNVSSDDDYNDLFSSIDESLGDSGRSEDVEKYLKYENDGVEVRVVWYDDREDDDPNKFYFIAYNKYGEEVDDYPLPEKTKMNINRSTETAIDKYGNKYKMTIL